MTRTTLVKTGVILIVALLVAVAGRLGISYLTSGSLATTSYLVESSVSTTGPGPSSNPMQIDVTGLMLRNELTLKHWGLTSGRLEVEVLRPDGKRFAAWTWTSAADEKTYRLDPALTGTWKAVITARDAEGSYSVDWVAK